MVKARSMRMARIASFSFRSTVWSLDEQEILGHLLGDGRGADRAPARLQIAHIGDDGADDALNVEPAMLIEVLVLGGDEGLDDAFGNGGDRHVDAPLAREFGDQRAVIGVDAGHHRRLVFGEDLVVRQFARHLPQHEGGRAGDGDEHDHAGGEHEAEKTQEKAAAASAPPVLRRLDWSRNVHSSNPSQPRFQKRGVPEATLAKIMATKRWRRRKFSFLSACCWAIGTSERVPGDALGEIGVDRFRTPPLRSGRAKPRR